MNEPQLRGLPSMWTKRYGLNVERFCSVKGSKLYIDMPGYPRVVFTYGKGYEVPIKQKEFEAGTIFPAVVRWLNTHIKHPPPYYG